MLRYAIVSLALAGALPACKDTPSYELRWDLAPREDPTERIEITHAFQCSTLGITAVEAKAIDDLGLVADVTIFPCFPESFDDPDATVRGPELPAGTYTLEVRGVQRDRDEWFDPVELEKLKTPGDDDYEEQPRCEPSAETLGCLPSDIACDCQPFDVISDETYNDFESFFLTPAPPECVDAVDNDVDGFVDAQDPGCNPREGAGSCTDGIDNDDDGAVDDDDATCLAVEGGDAAVVQFRMLVTILDVNPVAVCGSPLTKFRIAAVGQDGERITLAVTECRINGPLFFAAEIRGDDGPYSIEVTGLGVGDEPLTKPLVGATMVDAGTAALVDVRVDFGEDDFDPPLVASTKVSLGFASELPGDGYRGCVPNVGEGLLHIASTTTILLDADGNLVEGLAPFDGVPTTCTSNDLITQGLEWGNYRLVADARADDGTVCFATAPEGVPLAPGRIVVNLPRVLVDGVPPPSCRDCVVTDIPCGTHECINGVCR